MKTEDLRINLRGGGFTEAEIDEMVAACQTEFDLHSLLGRKSKAFLSNPPVTEPLPWPMKPLLILLVPLLLSGCTASLQYHDPESGISAGLSHDFDGKTIKRLRGYAK